MNLSNEKLAWSFKEVTAAIGIPRSTLYELINEGKFPKPFQLTDRRKAFLVKDISKWLESQAKTA